MPIHTCCFHSEKVLFSKHLNSKCVRFFIQFMTILLSIFERNAHKEDVIVLNFLIERSIENMSHILMTHHEYSEISIEKCIELQNNLYNKDLIDFEFSSYPMDMLAHELSLLPILRPFCINSVVDICKRILKSDCQDMFSYYIIRYSLMFCPHILRKLSLSGSIDIKTILERLYERANLFQAMFFLEFFEFGRLFTFFDEHNIRNEDYFVHQNTSFVKEIIEYGFPSNSIEFLIKYDLANEIMVSISQPSFSKASISKWSPFEWSQRPKSLNLLSICAHFGSAKCFRLLLVNGFSIDTHTINEAVFSGDYDIFWMCTQHHQFGIDTHISFDCFRTDFMDYLVSKGNSFSLTSFSKNFNYLCFLFDVNNVETINCGFVLIFMLKSDFYPRNSYQSSSIWELLRCK